MNLIPNPYLMLFVFVVFIALIVILNHWLYQPLLAIMEKRKQMLQVNSQSLEKEKAEIEKIHQEIRMVLDSAMAEAKSIRDQAISDGQKYYDESFGKAKNEIEMRFLESKKALEKQREKIKEEIGKDRNLLYQEIKKKIAEIEG